MSERTTAGAVPGFIVGALLVGAMWAGSAAMLREPEGPVIGRLTFNAAGALCAEPVSGGVYHLEVVQDGRG